MRLSDERMVVIINYNNSAQVMNENDVKKVSTCIVNLYMTLILLELKFNDTLSIEKINILIKNVHKSWCDHLTEIKQSIYDVSATYDLSNYMKFQLRKETVFQLHQLVHFMHHLVD